MKFMKVSPLFFTLVLLAPPARAAAPLKEYELAVGMNHACAIDEDGVKCWGSNKFGQTNVPPLKNPRNLVAGSHHSCVIDDEGAKCWGDSAGGKTKVPLLKNPRQIVPAWYNTCAIDDSGLRCWGNNDARINDVPSLHHPRQVAVGTEHACALDDNGVTCWGYQEPGFGWGRMNPPPLKNPKEIRAAFGHTCALDDEGLKCWGYNAHGQIKVPKELKNPRAVTLGDYHTCAIDDSGVKCWGDNDQGQRNSPPLWQPKIVEAGGVSTCALSQDGMNCWGWLGKSIIPDLKFLSLFRLIDISSQFSLLRRTSTIVRAGFFQKMGDAAAGIAGESRDANLTRYLILGLAAPAVFSNDSAYYFGSVIPGYKKSLSLIQAELGVTDISEIPDSETNRRIALISMSASLFSMVDFLNPLDRTAMQGALRLIGEAIAVPMDAGKIRFALEELDRHAFLFQKISNNPKSAFLVQIIQSATNWLKGKQ